MLRLSIHRATGGMVVAAPVLLPDRPDHVLLKPGAMLDADTIQRLIELNVRVLCVEYPPTQFLMRYCNPAVVAEQAALATSVGHCVDAVMSGSHAQFDFLQYLTGIRSLIARLVEDPDAAMFVGDIVDAGEPMVGHSFNVGMLSLLMGLRLDGYLVASRKRLDARRAQSVESLGLGGLLHDVGMLRLDPDVLKRWNADAAEDDEGWRQHVIRGYELVKGRIPTAATVVLHHHQRLDGSGFPPKRAGGGPMLLAQSGREIHVFARIVAVADVFNRMRRPAAQPGVVEPTVRALRRTLEQVRAGKLDPVAFRALLTVVPAFAPGTVVKLTDARTYVVTEWHPEEPCRPTLCALAFDDVLFPDPRLTPGPQLDLRERRTLRVTHAEGQHVEHDLFEPLSHGEFDLRSPIPPAALVEPMDPWGNAGEPPSKLAG